MNLETKKTLDYYAGGLGMALVRPWVWLLGLFLHRDHAPEVRDSLCFVKMLGGGSLVIAYPALLGLRLRHPDATLSLITLRGVRPFAESLGVFDRIDEIDDSSAARLVASALRCLWRNLRVDTVVDLEVYSRLTTLLSTLTGARNRVGFYLESVFWRRRLHTHLLFFNRFSGSFHWYDAVARLLGVEPASVEQCRRRLRERFRPGSAQAGAPRRIAIGHGCSDFARERMLDEDQWSVVLERRLPASQPAEVIFLGARDDRPLADRVVERAAGRVPWVCFRNRCGELPLDGSLEVLASCHEFWGVDSALLHYARLLSLRCVSFWGPTDPATRLRHMADLEEEVHYGKVPCSPCVHVAEEPPCRGDNVCVRGLFGGGRAPDSIWWLTSGSAPCRAGRRSAQAAK